jgi:hypothetical protein
MKKLILIFIIISLVMNNLDIASKFFPKMNEYIKQIKEKFSELGISTDDIKKLSSKTEEDK